MGGVVVEIRSRVNPQSDRRPSHDPTRKRVVVSTLKAKHCQKLATLLFHDPCTFHENKAPHLDRVAIAKAHYWRANIRVVLTLMGLWFLFGCVLSIFAVDALNTFKLGGFPLGFWMAQQGNTIAFIVIVFCYVFIMKRLDEGYARSVCNDEGAQDS